MIVSKLNIKQIITGEFQHKLDITNVIEPIYLENRIGSISLRSHDNEEIKLYNLKKLWGRD